MNPGRRKVSPQRMPPKSRLFSFSQLFLFFTFVPLSTRTLTVILKAPTKRNRIKCSPLAGSPD